jgi:hypothetical protein
MSNITSCVLFIQETFDDSNGEPKVDAMAELKRTKGQRMTNKTPDMKLEIITFVVKFRYNGQQK